MSLSGHRTLTLRIPLRRPPAPAAVMAEIIASPSDAWLLTPLTQQECADWLHIHPSTLCEWTSAGRVPHGRVGAKPVYLRADLLPLIRAGRLPLPVDEGA